LKESLSSSTLNYVLSLERDGTYTSEKVAATAGIYHINNYTEDGKYRSSTIEQSRLRFEGREHFLVTASAINDNRGNVVSRSLHNAIKPKARCFKCKSDQHLVVSNFIGCVPVAPSGECSRG